MGEMGRAEQVIIILTFAASMERAYREMYDQAAYGLLMAIFFFLVYRADAAGRGRS